MKGITLVVILAIVVFGIAGNPVFRRADCEIDR